MSGWDWNNFVSTLLATLLGGLLGVGAVWIGFRLQRRDQYQNVMDDVMVRVVEQISALMLVINLRFPDHDGSDAATIAMIEFPADESGNQEPALWEMLTSLEVALLRARGVDRDVLWSAHEAIQAMRSHTFAVWQFISLEEMRGILMGWRSTQMTGEEAIAAIKDLPRPPVWDRPPSAGDDHTEIENGS